MAITILPGGDRLVRDERAIIIKLNGPRKILSTSFLNGGCQLDLRFLFNYCEVYDKDDEQCEMRAPSYKEHLQIIAEELGLDPSYSAGLSTAAKMKYAVIRTESYTDFSVTALVTAGIDVNGGRAGDPALRHEGNGQKLFNQPGTINIIMLIDANLSDEAMAKALVTCTEAKCAALQELLAPSCYSTGLATGSGTDGTIISANPESKTILRDAGLHTKLGEHIGRLVIGAVKDALVAENGFEPYACGSLIKRIKRYGITEESLRQSVKTEIIDQRFNELIKNEQIIALATLFMHLLDLINWRLAKPFEAIEAGRDLLAVMADRLDLPPPGLPKSERGKDETVGDLLLEFNQLLTLYLEG